MKNTAFLILTLLLSFRLPAQEHFVFSPVSSLNGLSDNRVRTICQLPDGRMVIVTEGLVNIYDGAIFRYMHYNELMAYPLSGNFMPHRAYIDNENRLWLKNQSKLMLFDIGRELFVPDIDSVFEAQGITGRVDNFFVDDGDNIWYQTQKDQLILRNGRNKKTSLFINQLSEAGDLNDLLVDVCSIEKQVFLIYKSGMIVCYDLDTRREKYRRRIFSKKKDVISLLAVPFKRYLYLTQNKDDFGLVLRYNTLSGETDTVLHTPHGLATVTVDSQGNCWISSVNGLWKIEKNLKNNRRIPQLELNNGQIYRANLCTQYNDDKGGLWVGSVNRGVFYYHPDRFKFRKFTSSWFKHPTTIDLSVNGFTEKDGYILIGTQNGLYKYAKDEQFIEPFNLIPAETQCYMLLKDSKERVWVCTNKGLMSISGDIIKRYNKPFACFYMYEAAIDKFLLCTNQGVWIFDSQTGECTRPESNSERKLTWTYQLVRYNGSSLLGYSSEGLFIYNSRDNTLSFPEKDSPLLRYRSHYYHCLFTDSRGLIWIGTMDGLNVYNPFNDAITSFSDEEGLINNSIRSVIEDNSGNIWVSTSNGISLIELTHDSGSYKFSFRNYNHLDGVIKSEFMPRSVYKSSDNRLLWGGLDGFNELHLNRFDSSKHELPAPLFTNFFVSGTKVKQGELYDGNIILKQSISSTREIKLNYFQNSIGFEFTALNYVNPTQTYYRYKLEGVDDNWQEIKTSDGIGRINYSSLTPKTYRLQVRAANNNGNWSNKNAQMTITIRPPFWKTTWAYFVYISLLIGGMYLSFSFYVRRNKQKLQKQQKEELDQMKLSFFTNIGHELRTPLTLILTPLGSMLKKTTDGPLKMQLTGIYRNASELLKLVNQLLDLRKIESKGETLQLGYCNIYEFIQRIVYYFQELKTEKEFDFKFECSDKTIYAYVDKDKLQKIINNLLSNAFKFTPKGGSILIALEKSTDGSEIKIKVVDSGVGIPETDLPKIFDRFYQAANNYHNTGSGIGLHLAKEYALLHKGSIDVKSKIGNGSTFTISIPTNLYPEDLTPVDHIKSKHPVKLLIIEDNAEFRNFLSNELSSKYQIFLASNGKEGLKKALAKQPDLVISDVMMPEMSGIEFCQKLKQDVQIAHIPVILLTAKSSDDAQIEGFEAGADAYVSKPFNLDILMLRINNLISLQQKRQSLFKKSVKINPGSFTSTDVDEQLLNKILRCIEENMDNSSYSVEQLSKDLLMDRTGLYRKLMAIVGQTPTDFIRSVRLKKAAQLLEKGVPVTEVVEKVGFVYSSTGYFAKCFYDEFGVKPSQYKATKKNNDLNGVTPT